jgi:predicted AAA+ superfamily ATPase
LRGVYLKEPSRFYDEVKAKAGENTNKLYVLVDEIQLLPELLFEVHRLIEEFKDSCVFALTGSSARKIKKTESDLLAGRALGFKFFPFISSEVDYKNNLDKVLQFGSLPEVFLESDESIVVEILRTYADKYLREEIQQESLVRNLPGFSRFLSEVQVCRNRRRRKTGPMRT